MQKPRILVVGAGIAGVACAQTLRSAGVAVRLVDRGRAPGGRMASRTIGGRPVDLGAAYFTAESGSAFERVVAQWVERGLAQPWTDTLAVAGPEGILSWTTGPMRYAARAGLRGLVVDLAQGLDVQQGVTVERVGPGEADGERYDTVVLAMPDPQARRLLQSPLPFPLDAVWEPSIAVVLEWAARDWQPFHAAFVNDSAELTTLADDGDRRGDAAPVLVAHTTEALAREFLDDPEAAVAPATAAVQRVLSLTDTPVHAVAHRWSFARPAAQHPEPFFLGDGIALCGDAWGARSSVATAWASGHALGLAIAGAVNIVDTTTTRA
jgi:predicted NAD/FAD-dependent oxidoreductase